MSARGESIHARFLSIADAADRLGLKDAAIRRAINRGELPASKICSRIRIDEIDFEKWIEANRVSPVSTPVASAPVHVPARHGLRRLLDDSDDAP